MIRARVQYGVEADVAVRVLEFPDGTDPQQIEDACSDAARADFWWTHEILSDEAG